MNIYEAIIALYPDLKPDDFDFGGTISLRNDSDGRGDYILEWNHPTYKQPTEEQLIAAGWVK
ncbi:Bacteriophage SP-beta, YorD [uncultured Caudovirales phage]|uniref:Bacteriophage SP-beta, YorD n=1 Tax=uncultured Caudovirales phage TaxID=2100421 RepID=A0A6J5LRQ6_9CAUD|nr:Bacteriophage SP-beta, YorD [uncultured Caudovirales phage]